MKNTGNGIVHTFQADDSWGLIVFYLVLTFLIFMGIHIPSLQDFVEPLRVWGRPITCPYGTNKVV